MFVQIFGYRLAAIRSENRIHAGCDLLTQFELICLVQSCGKRN
jgi:hypothetical protein